MKKYILDRDQVIEYITKGTLCDIHNGRCFLVHSGQIQEALAALETSSGQTILQVDKKDFCQLISQGNSFHEVLLT